MKCDLEYDFHDLDKMPKHVEMIRTKCQPKSWDGQNANHRKKSAQNANLGWHYVRLAFCPVGILSAHRHLRHNKLKTENETPVKEKPTHLLAISITAFPSRSTTVAQVTSGPGGGLKADV